MIDQPLPGQNGKKNSTFLKLVRPLVAVGIAIVNENKEVLLLRRKGKFEGDWCFPGGHVEFGEKVSTAAMREVQEEVGIYLGSLDHNTWKLAEVIGEESHYITMMVTSKPLGEIKPQLMEPDKFYEFKWVSKNDLPKELWEHCRKYIEETGILN